MVRASLLPDSVSLAEYRERDHDSPKKAEVLTG